MEFTAIFGIIGLFANLAVFGLVVGQLASRFNTLFAVLSALIIVVYGLPLAVLGLMFIGLPWQTTNIFIALIAGGAFAFGAVRSNFLHGLSNLTYSIRKNLLSVLIISAFVLFHAMIAVLKPELSIDGQLYHGPVLATLVSEGTVWGWSPVNQYFFYTDLTMVQGLNLATFTGGTRFDDALQIPHYLLILISITWALRSRFTNSFVRVSIALLITSAPVIWLQPRILYVDLAYGTAVFLAILLMASPKKYGPFGWILIGITIAAVIATKPAGLVSGIFLTAVSLVILIISERKSPQRARNLGFGALGLLLPMFFGLSFYLRNLFSFSNPIYPVQANFGPISFPGIVDLSVFASGDRGEGVADLSRIVTFMANIYTGSIHGVEKLDYDPRAGGFGYIPVVVIGLVLLSITIQLLQNINNLSNLSLKKLISQKQVMMTLLGLGIIILQPSTFDSRYVIGPVIVFLVVIVLATISIRPNSFLDLAIGLLAFAICLVQIAWNERNLYPGLHQIVETRFLSSEYQPATPGNPWGAARSIQWLPKNDGCQEIVVQTNGGVTPSGMNESSFFATLPYSLYGDQLCNSVFPVTIPNFYKDSNGSIQSIGSKYIFGRADFALLNVENHPQWAEIIPSFSECFTQIDLLAGNESYPELVAVFANRCK